MAKRITEEDLRLNFIVNGNKAQKELIELENQTSKLAQTNKDLRLEKARLISEGKKGTEEYKRLTAQIKENNTAIEKNKAKMEVLRKEIGVAGMSFNQLNKRAKDLRMQINSMTPSNPNRAKLIAELKQIDAQLDKTRISAKQTKLSLASMSDGFNRYFGMAAAFAASFTGVILGFRQLIQSANDYEESLDGLSSITGLVGEELDWLGEKSKEMSIETTKDGIRITKSAIDINNAFAKVGSKRPELLAVKEDLAAVTKDAIILSQAARGELEPSVNALTISLNQFNAGADQSRRYINAIAAGSKAGAGDIPYISKAVEKAGTVAADADIEFETLIGSIETLAPKISDGAKAGNHLEKIFLKMQSQVDEFNPRVVGLTQALHNMNDADLSVVEVKKMFGEEHVTAAKILIDSVQEVERYTAAVTGTNTAIEQASINTDNNAAKLEQAKNKYQLTAIALGEKLAPALTFSTNSFSYLMKAMVAGIEVWKEHKALIKSAIAGIIAYTIAVNADTAAKKLNAFWTNKVKAAFIGLNKTVKANPWGLALAAGVAFVTFLANYRKQTKAAAVDTAKFHAELDKEKSQMNKLFEDAKKAQAGTEARTRAIKRLKDEYPEYLGNLLNEKSNLEDIEKAQKLANEAMEEKFALMAKEEDRQAAFDKKKEERQEAFKRVMDNIRDNTSGDEEFNQMAERFKEMIEYSLQSGLTMEQAIARARTNGKALASDLGVNTHEITTNLIDVIQAEKEYQSALVEIDKFYSTFIKNKKSATDKANGNDPEKATPDEPIKRTVKLIEEEISALKKRQSEESVTHAQYMSFQRDIKKLEKEKEAITGKSSDKSRKKVVDNYQKILEAYRKLQFEVQNLGESADIVELKRIDQKYDAMIKAAKGNKKEIAVIERMRDLEKQKIKDESLRTDLANEEKRKKILAQKSKEISSLLLSEEEFRVQEAEEYWNEFIKWAEENGMGKEAEALREKMKKAIADIHKEFDAKKDKDILGMSQEQWQNLFDNLDMAMNLAGSLMGMWQAYNDYQTAQEEKQLQRAEFASEKRKADLANRLEFGLVSEERYAFDVENIDKALDDKKKKIAYDQAKRDRNVKLAQVGIDTAAAVMRIWADVPKVDFGISTGILTGVAIATGALQAAAIASTPLPELASGNYLEVLGQSGRKYTASMASGSGLYSQPTVFNNNKIVGEEQPELVFSGPDTKKILNTPELMAAINYTIGLPEYASGNYQSTSTGTPGNNELKRLNDILESGIVAKLLADNDYVDTHNTAVKRSSRINNQNNF
jgi:TP901 family phage tail tape measure protein